MHVSVIIPTTAESARDEQLHRAVESLINQRAITCCVILVVNGPRCDESVVQRIGQFPVTIIRQAEGSLPAAIHRGRAAVRTDFFAFLDDDDVYLPDALAERLEVLQTSGADVVVSNGLCANGSVVIEDINRVEQNALISLLNKNWLASCGGLYRSETVSERFFHRLTKYYEWTHVAFDLLMAGKKVRFIDSATYQISDTVGSASKLRNAEHMMCAVEIAEYMRKRVPQNLRRKLSGKLAEAYHDASCVYMSTGQLTLAWRMHYSSMLWGGWKYISYTRHLLSQSTPKFGLTRRSIVREPSR